jgi:hypothetical protein
MIPFGRRIFLSIAFFAILAPIVADVITPAIYILEADEAEDEDAYVAASSARIDGTINGDLLIASGAIDIGGVVTGDVFVLSHSRLRISGAVEGSVRGIARSIEISGTVGGDVAVVAGALNVEGEVARDVLLFAGSATLTGSAGRDVKGRFLDGDFDGAVGRDVDVTVRSLSIGPRTDVGEDLIYRADGDASISGGASVEGRLERLPSRATFIVRVWLTAATILAFPAFVASGFLLLLIFRSTMARASGLVRTVPLRALWVGFLAVIGLPLLSVFLLFTLVGAPVGILVALLWLFALVFAPVPAISAGGDYLLRGRGGLLGAFVVGALVWRLGIWLIPVFGVLLYTTALAAGTGGLVMAAWRQRRSVVSGAAPLLPPPPADAEPPFPEDWEPPLAPTTRRFREESDAAETPPE